MFGRYVFFEMISLCMSSSLVEWMSLNKTDLYWFFFAVKMDNISWHYMSKKKKMKTGILSFNGADSFIKNSITLLCSCFLTSINTNTTFVVQYCAMQFVLCKIKNISRQFFLFLWLSSNDQLSVANSEDLFSLISFLMRSIQLQHIYRNFDNLLRKNLRLFIFHLHLMHKTFTIHGYLRPFHNWRRRRSDKIFVRLKKIRYGS